MDRNELRRTKQKLKLLEEGEGVYGLLIDALRCFDVEINEFEASPLNYVPYIDCVRDRYRKIIEDNTPPVDGQLNLEF